MWLKVMISGPPKKPTSTGISDSSRKNFGLLEKLKKYGQKSSESTGKSRSTGNLEDLLREPQDGRLRWSLAELPDIPMETAFTEGQPTGK